MLAHPVELLDGVAETVADARPTATAWCWSPRATCSTRSRRWPRSGLADHFERVEIVSEKDEATYRRVLADHGVADPATFLMVGNSVRSDVLPGARHRRPRRPGPLRAHLEPRGGRDHGATFPVLARLADLPAWLPELGEATGSSTSASGGHEALPELVVERRRARGGPAAAWPRRVHDEAGRPTDVDLLVLGPRALTRSSGPDGRSGPGRRGRFGSW